MADTMNVTHDVKDLGLAAQGKLKIEWADRQMPVLQRQSHPVQPHRARVRLRRELDRGGLSCC